MKKILALAVAIVPQSAQASIVWWESGIVREHLQDRLLAGDVERWQDSLLSLLSLLGLA